MQIPSFHAGRFNGFRIRADKQVQLYLTTVESDAFVLVLEGVEALALTSIKEGNITLDLAIRSGHELTASDIEQLYGMGETPTVEKRFNAAVEKQFQLLEINPSYGAEGLVLFRTWKLQPQSNYRHTRTKRDVWPFWKYRIIRMLVASSH
jgi:hypothetical protein